MFTKKMLICYVITYKDGREYGKGHAFISVGFWEDANVKIQQYILAIHNLLPKDEVQIPVITGIYKL